MAEHKKLPTNASQEQIIERINQLHGLLVLATNEVTEMYQWMSNGEPPCPEPNQKCVALEISKKLQGRFRWQAWTIGVLTVIFPAAATFGAVMFTNYGSASARAAGVEATRTTLAIEMPKYLQSAEIIADRAAEKGSDRALRKFVAEQSPKPIDKTPDKILSRKDTR
jgi:hypothetical protein